MKTATRKPRMHRLAKVGDKVSIHLKRSHPDYPNGSIGTVVEVLGGCCGPILGIKLPHMPNLTLDLFWKKTRIVR